MSPSRRAANAFLMASWCDPRERRVDEVAGVGVTRVHRQLVAVLDGVPNGVDVGEVQPRVHALRIQVQRHVDEVQVAGALAVAEEAALQPVGAGHDGEFTCRGAGAAVVVRMHRQHDAVAAGQVAVHPLDHVGEQVGRGVLHRGGQVDDALALGRGLPHGRHGVHHALAERKLGAREHLGRVLEGPLRLRLRLRERREQPRLGRGQLDDAVLVQPEHDAAHHRRRRVVQVHDGPPCAHERLERAPDQRLAGLRQHLDGDVVGHQIVVDQLAHEVELDLRRGREADLDLLEADVHEGLEHPQLARHVHRFDQRLVAVPQVHAAPHGRAGDHGVGPGAVAQPDRGERSVLGGGVLQHGGSWRGCGVPQRPNANGPLRVQTGR
jgi:hypothetical protein